MNVEPRRLGRREAVARILAATAVLRTLDVSAFGAPLKPAARGIGTDPNLLAKDTPWDRVLTEAERRTLAALADTFLPEDPPHPSASALAVHEFIDEWISAPYEEQQADQPVVREAIAWFDAAARAGHQKGFADLPPEARAALFDAVSTPGDPSHTAAFRLYEKVRRLVIGGYYSTPRGWADIGYVGNRPMAGEWPGPPPEILARLGLS